MTCQKCEICKEAPSKYKCPTCLVPYCSLGCFKKHKENPCKKLLPPMEDLSKELPERSYQVDEANWVVSKEQLRSIVESSKILDALKDDDLRKLICKVDSSNDPEAELTKAMSVQSFQEFTEKILSIVSPQEQCLRLE